MIWNQQFLQPCDVNLTLVILSGSALLPLVQQIENLIAVNLVKGHPDLKILIAWFL